VVAIITIGIDIAVRSMASPRAAVIRAAMPTERKNENEANSTMPIAGATYVVSVAPASIIAGWAKLMTPVALNTITNARASSA